MRLKPWATTTPATSWTGCRRKRRAPAAKACSGYAASYQRISGQAHHPHRGALVDACQIAAECALLYSDRVADLGKHVAPFGLLPLRTVGDREDQLTVA